MSCLFIDSSTIDCFSTIIGSVYLLAGAGVFAIYFYIFEAHIVYFYFIQDHIQ
jgi:hypothetical protein